MDVITTPYVDADAPDIAAFFTSAAALDESLKPMDTAAVRGFVAMSFNSQGRDFAVTRSTATADRPVIAFLMSALSDTEDGPPERNVRIIVHPQHRRRGIARSLADLVDAQDPAGDATVQATTVQATTVQATTVQATTMGVWKVGEGMLARRGFNVTEGFLWMRLDRDAPHATEAPTPDGVRLRPARHDAADDAAWKRLNREGYAGSSEFIDLTDADLEARRAEKGFHLWFAERHGQDGGDGHVVGFCQTTDFSGSGCVESLVVSPTERGRGTGRALLVAGIRTLWEQEPARLCLSVRVENTPAVSLYRSVGFETEDTMSTWQRPPRE